MAITRGTLAQEIDGFVEYIYPKTEAGLVEFDTTQTVKEKIESMDNDINSINERIDNLIKKYDEEINLLKSK